MVIENRGGAGGNIAATTADLTVGAPNLIALSGIALRVSQRIRSTISTVRKPVTSL